MQAICSLDTCGALFDQHVLADKGHRLQGINRITDEVIEQHSLSSCSITSPHPSRPISSSQGQFGPDLSSSLQQMNLAPDESPHNTPAVAPASPEPHASSCGGHETGRQAVHGTCGKSNSHSAAAADGGADDKRLPEHSQRAAVEQALQHQHQLPTQVLPEPSKQHGTCGKSNSQSAAESDGVADDKRLPDQSPKASAEQHPNRYQQIPVPCVSIAGWDESPVTVRCCLCAPCSCASCLLGFHFWQVRVTKSW